MLIRVGIENNNDGRSIAWALEHPGCFAYGADGAEAEANIPGAVEEYAAWVHAHGMRWMDNGDLRISVEGMFEDHQLYPDPAILSEEERNPMVEAFFHGDMEPLSGTDVERGIKLLEWSRQELLHSIRGLTEEQLNEKLPDERWSINGILLHVGHAEWWYAACIVPPMPPNENDLPAEPLGCLELVRAHFTSVLIKQIGVHFITSVEGETWSLRKMLRRAAWHERDHAQHIWKVRKAGGWGGY